MSVQTLYKHSKSMGMREKLDLSQCLNSVITKHTILVQTCLSDSNTTDFFCTNTVQTPDLYKHFSRGELA